MSMHASLPYEPRANGDAPRTDASETGRLAAFAQEEYANRRRRDGIFRPGIFAEPAWDMLLDLYVQEHLKRSVSIHSLCIAAAVPPTTALRWIGKLVERGLVERQPSVHDNRVIYIALTADGRTEMERYLRPRLHASQPKG